MSQPSESQRRRRQSHRGHPHHPKDAVLREQFHAVLHNLRQTPLPEDEFVVNRFLDVDAHVTVEEFAATLAAENPEIDVSHVRRAFRLLAALGIAQSVRFGDRIVYEHRHLDGHHDHLVCLKCGKIQEFADERLEQRQLAACTAAGFQPLTHRLVILGLCADCGAKLPPTRALSACLPGEAVEIAELAGGTVFRRRLEALGLVRGTRAVVLGVDGPITLDVRGSRLALGQGEAAKVLVRAPSDGKDAYAAPSP